MPASPWKSFADISRDQPLLVLVTYLPLKRLSSTPRFARLIGAIRKQLADTPGLVGYSMLAKPFGRQYWTLSTWEDESALQAFVHQSPHQEVMSDLARHMGATRFLRWTMVGSEGRPSWDEALSRLR